jgi:hypothetical protein
LLIVLLLADAVLAWLALQGAFVFLEIVWRALARTADWRPLVETHARQFSGLRSLEGVVWLATACVFAAWIRSARSTLARGGRLVGGGSAMRPLRVMVETWRAAARQPAAARVPSLLGWWSGLVCIALAVEAWALARLLAAGTALDLGRGLMLVMVASVLEIGVAVLTIFTVLAIQDGLVDVDLRGRPGV